MWEIHQQPPPRQLHTLVSGELKLLCPLGWLDCGSVVDHTPQPCHWATLSKIKPFQWKKLSFFLTYTASSFPFSFLLPCTWLLIRWWWGLFHAQKDPRTWEILWGSNVPAQERWETGDSHEVTGPPVGLDQNPELHGWSQEGCCLGLSLIYPIMPLIWSTKKLQSMNCLKTHIKLLSTYTFLGREPTHFTILRTLWSHQSRPHRSQPEAQSPDITHRLGQLMWTWDKAQLAAQADLRGIPPLTVQHSRWLVRPQNPQNHIRSCRQRTPPPTYVNINNYYSFLQCLFQAGSYCLHLGDGVDLWQRQRDQHRKKVYVGTRPHPTSSKYLTYTCSHTHTKIT